jgi:hypothetical protein
MGGSRNTFAILIVYTNKIYRLIEVEPPPYENQRFRDWFLLTTLLVLGEDIKPYDARFLIFFRGAWPVFQ